MCLRQEAGNLRKIRPLPTYSRGRSGHVIAHSYDRVRKLARAHVATCKGAVAQPREGSGAVPTLLERGMRHVAENTASQRTEHRSGASLQCCGRSVSTDDLGTRDEHARIHICVGAGRDMHLLCQYIRRAHCLLIAIVQQ
eukprot:6210125-Pleurochrysis_carterae.AAC.6